MFERVGLVPVLGMVLESVLVPEPVLVPVLEREQVLVPVLEREQVPELERHKRQQ